MTDRVPEKLPDLSGVSLETLRKLDHAVLRNVAERLAGGGEDRPDMIWGHDSSTENPKPKD